MADAQTNSRLPGSAGAALAALALACFTSAPAAAAPQGEDVVSGEATFTRDGSLTQIDTATPQTIINWSGGFDIGAGETVLFNQPDALSNVLNYDPSSDPSHINGSLFSNGGVWIINPVGVFFGDQAIVDVGRLVAGAGKVDPEEFRAGVERWSELTGRVEVGAGAQIRAADSVLLVGAAVANYGNISAADGMVALVAGGEVRLARVDGRVIVTADRALAPDPERWAVVQAGTLDAGHGNVSLTAGDAYSLAINHTGITRARDIAVAGGEGGVVSVSGALDASDRSAGATGGAIAVTGDRVALLGAQLDASGDAGGGSIRVGGDLRGEGELPTAQRTYVDERSALRADAIATGDGGTIIIWSDEATRFYGALSARGGALGGDGGFAEISGASLASRGSIDLGASAGSAGTLLYDPKDILIVGGAAPVDGSDDPDTAPDQLVGSSAGQVLFGTPDELLSPFTIHESEIEGTDANVILEATNSIYTENSGAFAGAVTLRPDRSLTMLTRNNAGDEGITPGIQLAGVSFQTSGKGSIALATGNDGAGAGGSSSGAAGIEVDHLTTAGGAVSVTTKNGSISAGNVTTSGAPGTGSAGGKVTINAGGTGTLSVGSISALGDSSTAGRGGNGGAINLTGDSIAIGSDTAPATLDTTGGDGPGSLTAAGTRTGGGGDAGAITIDAKSDVVTHAAFVAMGGNTTTGGAGGRGGLGGIVSIDSETGDVTLHDTDGINPIVVVDGGAGRIETPIEIVNGVPRFDGQGGSAGSLNITVSGDDRLISVLGAVRAVGGAGFNGAGGAGGNVTLTAADGGVMFTTTDPTILSGGLGRGSVTTADGATVAQEVPGGNGGGVFLKASAATGTGAAGGDDVQLTGTIVSLGGDALFDDGTANPPKGGAGGTVRLTSAEKITAQVGDASVDNFEVVVSKVAGIVDVTGDGITAAGSSSTGSTHTITNLVTTADSPHFTYRLADGGDGPVDQVDLATLAVGGVTFGTSGGTLANARADSTAPAGEKLLGKIQGETGSQVTTVGNLQLFATSIGDVTPLAVAGTGGTSTLEITVAGNIGRLDDSQPQPIRNAGLALSGTLASVDVTQRSAAGDTVIDLPGGGDVTIDGTVVDDGASRTETSLVKRVATPADTGFFYALTNPTTSSGDAGSGEPKQRIARGAVDLGGDVGFTTIGDLILESAAEPTADAGTAIEANGHSVSLIADADGDGGGAIVASTLGTTDVADATKLTARAGSGVGSATPLRTSGASAFELIGRVTTGDLRLVHTGSGAATVSPIAVNADGVPEGGIQVGGEVEILDATGGIVFGGVQPSGATAPVPHVRSVVGGQSYVGALSVANDQVLLRAGGAIRFDGAIDADVAGRSLDVSAGGTTTFAGDVGATTPLDALTVSAARFEGDRSVTVASRGEFHAIEGTGSLALTALDTGSELVLHEDIGAVGDFRADAGRLSFVENMDRIAADSVSLNISPPPSTPDRFQYATIADTFGGLTIESAGTVTMGAGEKLSSLGPLVIRAGDTATLGDLAATELRVDAPEIVIQRRDPGLVALTNGAVVTDNGVDWVANNITTNVVPGSTGTGAAPTFFLGSGGIRTGGVIPFDVFRFTQRGDAVRAASFVGQDPRTLDLTGLGPRAVSDASNDIPRAAPPVLPGLAARPGHEPPSPPREVSSDELIGALHCRTAEGDPCAPPAVGDDPLASERALEIRQRYRALLAGEEAQQNLRAAFAPLARVPAGDVDALSRSLAHDPALGAARARIADLAVALAQVELLGLDESESERARRAIAADFAAATGVAGLYADAVLAAVDASGVAVLP